MALTLAAIWGLLLFLPASLGKWTIFKADERRPTAQRWLSAAMPICIAVMLFMAWIYIARSPWDDWNAARTAWAVAWAKGMPLYFPRGQGPATDFMYGPVAAIVRLPAAWMSSPTGAILVADVINVAIFFVPAILFIKSLRGDRLQTILALIIFVGFSLTMESLQYSAFAVHADAPAVGFAMLALWQIQRKRSLSNLVHSAIFTALSIGSKHTFAPLVLALPICVCISNGRRAALTLLAMQLFAFAMLTGISIRAFGYDAIVHQLITLPSHQPWQLENYGKPAAILLMTGWLLLDIAVPACVFVFVLLFVPSAAKRTWIFPLIVALAMLPGSLLARVKVGGNVNTYTACSYFIVVALCVWIATYRPRDGNSKIVLGGAQFLCIVLALQCLLPWIKFVDSYHFVADLKDNPQEQAYRFCKAHPRQAYFPWNPLSTLLSDGAYYHFDYGLVDRWLAREDPTEQQMLEHTPAKMKWMIYPPNAVETEDVRQFLPRFSRRTNLDELPAWRAYTADEPR